MANNNNEVKSASISSVRSNRTVVLRPSIAVLVSAVIILLGVSFWAGMLYGNGVRNSTARSIASDDNLISHRYAVGLVVYISQTSITISDEENSGSQTFVISPNTLVSINGAKATPAQINPGNIVLIEAYKKSPTKAAVILVNSHFSG
jgi:hypothetical protein